MSRDAAKGCRNRRGAVDREAVGERDLAARSRFCAILQIDVGSGEIGRDLDQAHADQMALQLGRAIEGAEDAEITSASAGRGAPERQPRAQRQQKTGNAGRGGRLPSHRRGSYPLLASGDGLLRSAISAQPSRGPFGTTHVNKYSDYHLIWPEL